MFTVALIGPDGCGKTTVATRLAQNGRSPGLLPLPAKYVYMGVNLETSNLVLPSTWLWLRLKKALGRRPDIGPPDSARRVRPKGLLRRVAAGVKGWLRLGNLLGEELFRQSVIAFHRRRGRIVLTDRDFFVDYYAHDVAPTGSKPRPWTSRLHGYVLRRFYRRPDLVLFLDAPAELLFQRKGEGTVESLERRRQEYVRLRDELRHFQTLDASRPLEHVLEEVRRRIVDFQQQTQ